MILRLAWTTQGTTDHKMERGGDRDSSPPSKKKPVNLCVFMDLVGACTTVLAFLVVLGTEPGALKVASFLPGLIGLFSNLRSCCCLVCSQTILPLPQLYK